MLVLLVLASASPPARSMPRHRRLSQEAQSVLSISHKFEARAEDLAKALARRSDQAPPSNQRPLVFFHLRKSGGSQMRDALRNAAREYNLSSFIPCYDGVPCESYAPPREMQHGPNLTGSPRYAILAGHLQYSGVEKWRWASSNLRGARVASAVTPPTTTCCPPATTSREREGNPDPATTPTLSRALAGDYPELGLATRQLGCVTMVRLLCRARPHRVTASITYGIVSATYGCSLRHIGLQPPLPTV